MILCVVIPVLCCIIVASLFYNNGFEFKEFLGPTLAIGIAILIGVSSINLGAIVNIHHDFQPEEGQKPVSSISTVILPEIIEDEDYYAIEAESKTDTHKKVYKVLAKNPDGSYSEEELPEEECKVVYKENATPKIYRNTYKLAENMFFWDFIGDKEDRYIIELENKNQLKTVKSSDWRNP